MTPQSEIIAYFSMEIALNQEMPTYSGGLGILAGDTLRSAADLNLPMVAVTLLHRKGYFSQALSQEGSQSESPVDWPIDKLCQELPARVEVRIENRAVHLRAWRYLVKGLSRREVPVLLLDSDLPENSAWDRSLTHFLYGGDAHYRLCQEVLLGIGGVRMLRALGFSNITRFHMNEGHAGMLTLELLDEFSRKDSRPLFTHIDVEKVRKLCVFTTHTPVPAGHDQFPLDLVSRVLGRNDIFAMEEVFCCEGVVNMTYLALNLSHYINGVAKRHGEVSRELLIPRKPFLHYQIDSITNGVHAATWICPAMQNVFDQFISGWREDNASLRSVMGVPGEDLWNAHVTAKKRLIDFVNRETDATMALETLTLGFARRITAYKRADLLFSNLERLRNLASVNFPLQIVFAGKAHPNDQEGKSIIRNIFKAKEQLRNRINIVYLPNYDMQLAQLIIPGVDVWLNTPQPPLEASGTSGMKAALNGVPSLSTLDGWWIEGCLNGITGWSIGGNSPNSSPSRGTAESDAESLYDKLEYSVIPAFYSDRRHFVNIMRQAIAINGSYFTTQRMLQQYVLRAYFG